jgi:hypothetical protein
MLHRIARWLISRSIDEDRPVPVWLRRWIDRDEELRQFETQSRQLEGRLKDDACGWIASQARSSEAFTGSATSVGRQRRVIAQPATFRGERILRWALGALGAMALATCAWFAVARWPWQRAEAERHGQDESRQIAQAPATPTISAADRKWLSATWNSSRASLGQWQARAQELPGRMETLKLPALSAIVEPAEAVGSTTGRALATLDRGMQSEEQQLTSDAKAAYSFFAYRLPASLARLVGWRPAED